MKFIFAFLLLATLSMVVNAIPHQLLKRTTTFNQCPPTENGGQPPQLTVVLSTDPAVPGQTDDFTISGTLSRPVNDNDNTIVQFFNTVSQNPVADPKIPFSQVLNVSVPAELPNPYGILVVVINIATGEVIGCAYSIVGGSSKPADLDYYPIPLL
ncbi:16954_t:CDS:2 [Entrophospora sp. SA101]|nr:16954_t:CDS:2 [Entrophospora sp. SA101]CAJ0835880.1 4671_t:CDS:2 [Entrophospora sp. SA101]